MSERRRNFNLFGYFINQSERYCSRRHMHHFGCPQSLRRRLTKKAVMG